ncbi:MAG: aminotransferase class IV [Thermoanaerobacteraceae bacterium]|nr:aminotransferase class IV [Thermoanaerobacteraceae bacterium]
MGYYCCLKKDIIVSNAFLYGMSVFETILIENGNAEYLKDHYLRMIDGLKKLNIEFNVKYEEIKEKVYEYIKENRLTKSILRLTAFEQGYLITHREYNYKKENFKEGIDLCFAKSIRDKNNPLTYIKSSNYAVNIIEAGIAKEKGFAQALFLNQHGEICETNCANIFFIDKCNIITPKVECGLLDGVMRQKIIKKAIDLGIKIVETQIKKEEIYKFQGAFVSNSIFKILPIKKINEIVFDISDITNKLLLYI